VGSEMCIRDRSNIDTTPSEIQYYEVQNNIATEDEATVIGNA